MPHKSGKISKSKKISQTTKSKKRKLQCYSDSNTSSSKKLKSQTVKVLSTSSKFVEKTRISKISNSKSDTNILKILAIFQKYCKGLEYEFTKNILFTRLHTSLKDMKICKSNLRKYVNLNYINGVQLIVDHLNYIAKYLGKTVKQIVNYFNLKREAALKLRSGALFWNQYILHFSSFIEKVKSWFKSSSDDCVMKLLQKLAKKCLDAKYETISIDLKFISFDFKYSNERLIQFAKDIFSSLDSNAKLLIRKITVYILAANCYNNAIAVDEDEECESSDDSDDDDDDSKSIYDNNTIFMTEKRQRLHSKLLSTVRSAHSAHSAHTAYTDM